MAVEVNEELPDLLASGQSQVATSAPQYNHKVDSNVNPSEIIWNAKVHFQVYFSGTTGGRGVGESVGKIQ